MCKKGEAVQRKMKKEMSRKKKMKKCVGEGNKGIFVEKKGNRKKKLCEKHENGECTGKRGNGNAQRGMQEKSGERKKLHKKREIRIN